MAGIEKHRKAPKVFALLVTIFRRNLLHGLCRI